MSNTPNKLQVLFTILNVQAVLYGVHERNTIRYLVAFESRRAAAIAVAAALPPPCRRLAAALPPPRRAPLPQLCRRSRL